MWRSQLSLANIGKERPFTCFNKSVTHIHGVYNLVVKSLASKVTRVYSIHWCVGWPSPLPPLGRGSEVPLFLSVVEVMNANSWPLIHALPSHRGPRSAVYLFTKWGTEWRARSSWRHCSTEVNNHYFTGWRLLTAGVKVSVRGWSQSTNLYQQMITDVTPAIEQK